MPSGIACAQRHSLRSKVAHAAEILHAQGPISTFIHTNPLHSLEHRPFEQAVREAERLLQGRGYLSNEEFRRVYRSGRITDDDVMAALAHRLSLWHAEPPMALPRLHMSPSALRRVRGKACPT